MSGDEATGPLRLDYDQTTDLLHSLTDVRFKLLALVPTISGLAVGLLSRTASAPELLAVGGLGLAATLGIALYELRNTQLYDYALYRARELEARLGQVSIFNPPRPGGLYRERPGHDLRVFGFATAGYDRGLALVYSAAIGGWSYLFAWGGLHALHVSQAQKIGGGIGAAAALLTLIEFLRVDGRPNKYGSPGGRDVQRPQASG
jgi:hypothetical protein